MHKKIAIVGAGFAGLALGWYLSPYFQLTFFHHLPLEESASAISGGLLHPFTGYGKAKLAKEGIEATCQVIQAAQEPLSTPIIEKREIVRPVLTKKQQQAFPKLVDQEIAFWWDKRELNTKLPQVNGEGALFIPGGLTLDTTAYLQGLYLQLKNRGAHFFQEKVTDLKALSSFDGRVLATGAYTLDFLSLPLELIKGQLLHYRGSLPFSLNSQAYIASKGKDTLVVGSTFEHHFSSFSPQESPELQELQRRAFDLYPTLASQIPLKKVSQVRASMKNHQMPLASSLELQTSTWVLTGFGSKGLLYHALFAKELAKKITSHFSIRTVD